METYTHSLVELLRILEELGHEIPEDIKNVQKLAEHYTQARYSDARLTEYEREEAEEAIKCMERILEHVKLL
ncbi:MAG: HEPN domain-containing protein [Thermoplasmata archaeon]|nr:HEPN domain-containing protein [Thermoplasmata archaeon]